MAYKAPVPKNMEWQSIVAESTKLKELAISGHWTNFLSLSDARLKHMKHFFKGFDSTDGELTKRVMEDIKSIRRDDILMQGLINKNQDSLSGDLGSLQEGIRVIKQYQAVI